MEGDCIDPSPRGERIELLAGMGDGILPEVVEGREPEARDPSRDVPVPPGKQASDPGVLEGEPKAGFLDASLYGIAAGSVAIAVVFMSAAAGASLDRWAVWVRGFFENLLKRFG